MRLRRTSAVTCLLCCWWMGQRRLMLPRRTAVGYLLLCTCILHGPHILAPNAVTIIIEQVRAVVRRLESPSTQDLKLKEDSASMHDCAALSNGFKFGLRNLNHWQLLNVSPEMRSCQVGAELFGAELACYDTS